MPWSISRTYIAATAPAIDQLRAAGWPYHHLRAPVVPSPILMGVVPSVSESQRTAFHAWSRTTTVLDEAAIMPAVGEEEWLLNRFPDRDELFEMKWFAAQTNTPVVYYQAETFGGHIECELAWEFGPRERALVHVAGRVEAFLITGGRSVTERAAGFEVLARVLRSCGVGLDRFGHFPPHHRDFNAGRYRALPADKGGTDR